VQHPIGSFFAGTAAWCLALEGVTSCGGLAVSPADAGNPAKDGSTQDAAGVDGAYLDTGAPADANALKPEVGTPECDVYDPSGNVVCVVCADDNWHCGLEVLQPCPQGTQTHSPCASHAECYLCTDAGTGELYTCKPGLFWGGPNTDSTCHF
jgi:hypothetical protein